MLTALACLVGVVRWWRGFARQEQPLTGLLRMPVLTACVSAFVSAMCSADNKPTRPCMTLWCCSCKEGGGGGLRPSGCLIRAMHRCVQHLCPAPPPQCLDSLIAKSPDIEKLSDYPGHVLLLRMLRRPAGFAYLKSRGWLVPQVQVWVWRGLRTGGFAVHLFSFYGLPRNALPPPAWTSHPGAPLTQPKHVWAHGGSE